MTVLDPSGVDRSREIPPIAGTAADQTELDTALRALRPKLRSGKFVFSTLSSNQISVLAQAEATVAEDEGMSAVLAKEVADTAGLGYDWVAAWITLRGVTPHQAPGVGAHVARTIGERGIPCHIMAGRNHDHVLVPWELRETVVAAVMEIAEAADHRLLSAA